MAFQEDSEHGKLALQLHLPIKQSKGLSSDKLNHKLNEFRYSSCVNAKLCIEKSHFVDIHALIARIIQFHH